MKTSVNMIRKLDKFEVIQRTKDGYFNANKLLSQWNSIMGENKKIKDFTKTKGAKDFIEALEQRLKEKGEHLPPIIAGRGRGNKTWMHPYMFMKYAMYLNPKFEVKVIEFVYDQLIEFRDTAGDLYKGLTQAVAIFENPDYVKLAKGLNYIIFGRHEKGIRQVATQEQLTKMNDLQKQLAFSIDMGYIRSFEELINEMRKLYFKNWS